MNQPKVSVIIPTYNRGYCIAACIRSVLAQSYENLEIIVVDDASSDDTQAQVALIDNPHVQYFVHEHNQGGAVARNTGIRQSSGEYIAFLDSDDLWLPEKLEKQMYGLLEKGSCGFSYTWLLCIDTAGHELHRQAPLFEDDCSQQILISNFIGTFSNVMVRRDLITFVGGLDEQMRSCQDWDLFIRLLRLTHVHCQREYLVQYLQDDKDAVRISLNPRAVVQGHRRILQKFAGAYRALSKKQRCEAWHVYFNIFASVGAFNETLRMFITIQAEQGGIASAWRLGRGLARSGKKALFRLLRMHGMRRLAS